MGLAGLVHRRNGLLEAFTGGHRAQVAVGVDDDGHAAGHGHARDARKISVGLRAHRAHADGGLLARNTCVGDVHVVVAGGQVSARALAQGEGCRCHRCCATGRESPRRCCRRRRRCSSWPGSRLRCCCRRCHRSGGTRQPIGRVVVTRGVTLHGRLTRGGVEIAGGVVKEGIEADGRVVATVEVAKERRSAEGRVVAAAGVVVERLEAAGRVEVAVDVAVERLMTIGRVESA